MERVTENKSVQTDPVIILPISEDFTKPDYAELLDNQLRSVISERYAAVPHYINVPSEYESIRESPANSLHVDALKAEGDYEPVPETSKKLLTLFSPIYILKTSTSSGDLGGCEVGDEFELISQLPDNPDMLYLKHLRTGGFIEIDRSHLALDTDTPLRLGNQDRGVVECFLLKCDTRYSFLIYRSEQDENVYILSANQHQMTKEALISHYAIRINKQNNCFYLEHERRLRHCFFPTFQQLVNDARVHQFIPLSKPIDRSLSMVEDKLWQIEYKHLTLGEKIGEGEFGEVLCGKWKRSGLFETINVAIKRLKLNNVASDEFASEIRAMKLLRNKYLVSLLGVSVDPLSNEKLMVTEFMVDGDLKRWLQKQTILPTHDLLINFCHQICLGMSCLERTNFVHRDLACRNILLRGNRAKIADFGMARINDEDVGVLTRKKTIGKVAYRWTAPEIFAGKPYTTRSDRWSFGICLIEIWSKGAMPYPTLEHMTEILTRVHAGYVHAKPKRCPEKYYKIIQTCLALDPENRPSFKTLSDRFEALLNDRKTETINRIEETNRNNGGRIYRDIDTAPLTVVNPIASIKMSQTNQKKNFSTTDQNPHTHAYATAATPKVLKSSSDDMSESTPTTRADDLSYHTTTQEDPSISCSYVPFQIDHSTKLPATPVDGKFSVATSTFYYSTAPSTNSTHVQPQQITDICKDSYKF